MKRYIFYLLTLCVNVLNVRSQVTLKIDDVTTQFTEVSLPYWLKAGQKVDLGTNVNSVSILEFNVNGSNLEFSQAISLKTSQTVPTSKVWKIEAIGLKSENLAIPTSTFMGNGSSISTESLPTVFQSPKKFEDAGTYKWKVPPGVTSICVEVWGAGGGGASSHAFLTPGGGGGGGGYAYQCFTVVSGTEYVITVGAGGAGGAVSTGVGSCGRSGGASSLGNLIIASGGGGGIKYISDCGGSIEFAGGTGGNSTNTFNISGNNGANGYEGGSGGGGANGGAGGPATSGIGKVGKAPGGGGGGGGGTPGNYSFDSGGNGARGQVYIYW